MVGLDDDCGLTLAWYHEWDPESSAMMLGFDLGKEEAQKKEKVATSRDMGPVDLAEGLVLHIWAATVPRTTGRVRDRCALPVVSRRTPHHTPCHASMGALAAEAAPGHAATCTSIIAVSIARRLSILRGNGRHATRRHP